MVFPTTGALTPSLTSRLSANTRAKWKERYRIVKKYGIRMVFSGVTCTGLVSLAKEAAVYGAKRHGKRYIGGILVNNSLTCISGGLPLLTNATKVVKYSKACHSACAAAWRTCHNVVELPFIVCDYGIFGEYVPSCGESDYDLYIPKTNIINEFIN